MNYSDNVKFGRLSDAFETNYSLTRLYSQYLNYFPEAITSEMIETVCTGTDITNEEAFRAILTELLGLSYDNPEDRVLIRDYLPNSVKLLDAKKYRNNPYYKNIKIKNKKVGSWELRNESYKPYRGFIADDMKIYADNREYATLGFFDEEFFFPAVLEDGNEWMTLTPVDLDTCEDAIEKARGEVITFGLGLGYYAYMCSEKPTVKSITVVEKSTDVIRLFENEILPQFSHPEKVHIINADAFDFAEKEMPKLHFDLAFVDTWRDGSDGLPMYEKMKPYEKLSPDTEFLYWIEGFILSRKRSLIFGDIKEKLDGGKAVSYETFEEIKSALFLK